jgi:cell division protein FtsI/penicillin-binding protein 2
MRLDDILKVIKLPENQFWRAVFVIPIIFLIGIILRLYNLNVSLYKDREKEKTERIIEVREIANLRYYDKKECDSVLNSVLNKQIQDLQKATKMVKNTINKTEKLIK